MRPSLIFWNPNSSTMYKYFCNNGIYLQKFVSGSDHVSVYIG